MKKKMYKMNHNRGFRRGFSLMELVVCMVIIGILALMIAPQIGEATRNAKLSTFTTNAKNLEASIIAYQGNNHGEYPKTGNDLDAYLEGGFDSLKDRPSGAQYIYQYDSTSERATLNCSLNLEGRTYTYTMKDGLKSE